MQKGIILGIILLLVGAGGFLFWRTQSSTFPAETADHNMSDATETEEDSDAVSGSLTFGLTDDPDVVVEMTGRKYEFSETEIRVKQGDVVRITLTSTEGMHDLVIDEFDVATPELQPDETASITFVADKTGTFEYYCSVGEHRALGMVGTLIVE